MALLYEIYYGNFPVNKKCVHSTVDKCSDFLKIHNGDLSIAFISNKEIKKLNKIYRKIDKATDVLSFGSLGRYSPSFEEGARYSPLFQRGVRGDFSEAKIRNLNFTVKARAVSERVRGYGRFDKSRAVEKSPRLPFADDPLWERGANAPYPPRPPANTAGMPLKKGVDTAYAEILISYEIAKKQSQENKISIKKEIERLLIHGILHLLGYDHKNDKDAKEMEEIEAQLLHC